MLPAAWAAQGLVRRPAEDALDTQLRRQVNAAGIDAADALAAAQRALVSRAGTMAAVPSLASAITTLDPATIAEQLNHEQPLDPYRAELPILGVLLAPDRAALRGASLAELPVEALFAEAKTTGASSRVAVVRGAAYLLAAVPLLVHPLDGSPAHDVLVLLGAKADGPEFARIASREQGAVALSDGAHVLAVSGPAGLQAALRTLIGSESKAERVDAAHLWSAASESVAPGLWLWTALDTSSQAGSTLASLRTECWGIDVAAAVLGLLVLGLGFLRRTSADIISGGLNNTALSVPRSGDVYSGRSTAPIPLATPAGGGGRPFGRYVLVDQLASGGMGEVFLAVAFGVEGFHRSFVIKRLRPELANVPELVGHFIEEARLSSSLVHANIVPVFEFGKVGEELFMAQEYIDGRDLERLTQKSLERDGRPLPPHLVFYAAQQVLQALAYAHGKADDAGRPLKLVHRDVSPQNVLVSSRGEVKLFDFGIVKSEAKATKTEAGVVKGNVSYMSPEQAQGKPVDARSDLFSLGMLMFRCLSGEMLYRDETPFQMLMHAARGPDAEDLARIAALPEPAPQVLARVLSVDPAQRFQSAAELAAALPAGRPGDAAELAALVVRLFGEKLAEERAKLAAAVPAGENATAIHGVAS